MHKDLLILKLNYLTHYCEHIMTDLLSNKTICFSTRSILIFTISKKDYCKLNRECTCQETNARSSHLVAIISYLNGENKDSSQNFYRELIWTATVWVSVPIVFLEKQLQSSIRIQNPKYCIKEVCNLQILSIFKKGLF